MTEKDFCLWKYLNRRLKSEMPENLLFSSQASNVVKVPIQRHAVIPSAATY